MRSGSIMKKTVAMVMALVLSFSGGLVLQEGTVWADPATSGYCGDPTVNEGKDVQWSYNGDTKTLTISGSGDMADYGDYNDEDYSPWRKANLEVNTVIIESGVTSIGDHAFNNCDSITDINIPSGVKRIGDSAFYNCRKIKEVIIPYGCTYIGRKALYSCDALKEITIPGSVRYTGIDAFNYCWGLERVTVEEGVTRIGVGEFEDCPKLTTVSLPKGLTAIEDNAFNECVSLKTIDIPATVTLIGNNAFCNCDELTEITLPSGIKTIEDGVFKDCDGLKAIVIPDTVTKIGIEAFSGCDYLKDLTLGNGLMSIGDSAFSECGSINKIKIPGNVKKIGNSAFYGCDGLDSVTIGNGVEEIGEEAFSDCDGLTAVNIPGSIKQIGVRAFKQCIELAALTLENGVTDVAEGVFEYCSKLENITFPDTLTAVGKSAFLGTAWLGIEKAKTETNKGFIYAGPVLYEYCGEIPEDGSITVKDGTLGIAGESFYYNESIKQVSLPDSLKCIGKEAFYHCTSLEEITVRKGNDKNDKNVLHDGLEVIDDNAFYNCFSLPEITIPSTVTCIGEDAFSSCGGLKTVTISEGVEIIGDGAFNNCNNTDFTKVTIPATVTRIGTSAFDSCGFLEDIDVPGTLASIGQYAFNNTAWENSQINDAENNSIYGPVYIGNVLYEVYGDASDVGELNIRNDIIGIADYTFEDKDFDCSLVLPETVRHIGEGAFKNCKLTGIVIPDGVTTIPVSAFDNCIELKTASIPESVTYIGEHAFYYCRALEDILIPAGVTAIGDEAFYDCDGLKKMYVMPVKPPVLEGELKQFDSMGAEGFRLYLRGEDYRTARGWRDEYYYYDEKIGIELFEAAADNGITITGEPAFTYADVPYYTEKTALTLAFGNSPAGYTVEYTYTDDKGKDVPFKGNSFSMPDRDVSFKRKLTPINYKITYNLGGGAMPAGVTNPASYNVESRGITLAAPVYEGYDFGGWFADAGFSVPVKGVAIPKGSIGDRVFYAKWTKKADPAPDPSNEDKPDDGKPAARVTKAPTAIKSLKYTGKSQKLVKKGTAKNGTMYYALTAKGSGAPDDSKYKKNIPTVKNAGSYTVWYKAKGDKKHSDSAAKSVNVTVSKIANTLSIGAKTATVKYNTLKNNDVKLTASKVISFKKKGQGTLSYTLSSAKLKKKSVTTLFLVNDKTGEVTVPMGLKKGDYKLTVKVKAAGNTNYKASAKKSVTYTVKVK
ncbi:MAG: leucine-rich repeat protein [Lachnospiraceae bacterium]|nr:leucine-rich repeat protein [Lachnospiraceae bacterium]